MKDRIKSLRKDLGLTQTDLGNALGVSKSAISQLELGKISLTEGNIKLICSEYGVNGEWLRTGDGEMFDMSDEEEFNRAFSMAEEDIPPLSKKLLRLYFDNPNLQKQIEELIKTAYHEYLEETKKEDE